MDKLESQCWNCDGEGVVIAHEDEPGAFPIICPVCKGKEKGQINLPWPKHNAGWWRKHIVRSS